MAFRRPAAGRSSPYGERTNAAFATQKGTIGARHDPETGLISLNARTMAPIFGRIYVAQLAKSQGARHGGIRISKSQAADAAKTLEIAVPTLGNAATQAALQSATARAASNGVTVTISVMP